MTCRVAVAAILFSSSLLLMIGCAGGGGSDAAADAGHAPAIDLDQAADVRSRAADESGMREMTPKELAAQFEQDLADFQNARRQTRGPDEPFPQIPHRSAGRPEIQFDEPTRPGVPHDRDRDAQGTLANTEQTIEVEPPAATHEADPAVRMREAMVNLRRELYQDASYSSEPLRQYLTMAALTLIDPERAVDPDAFPDLRDREREILRAYQSFFIELGRELHASGDEAQLVGLIDQLRGALIDEPQLNIAQAQLCTRVDGFGSFEAFDKNVFLAGSSQDVVIYTEVENFTSETNAENMWVTDLWQELIIYNSHDNVPVWHQEWQPATDKSARKRTDFFISHLVTLPDRLTVGSYTLKVRVRDDSTSVIAESGIPFQIVADRSLTARAAQ